MTFSWAGILCLIIFVVGYYFIAAETKYHINKTKPAVFIGSLMFIIIGIYVGLNGGDVADLNVKIKELIEEIAEIVFFLMVAMTYTEALIERNVFNTLKYNLVTKGYTYRKLFWLTGLLAFFISPIADNLTTALILSTVLLTIDDKKPEFLVPGAINIVVAANAGGAWSPFGDITTLMVWMAGKSPFIDFFALFPPSFIGWWVTAFFLSKYVPNVTPNFDTSNMKVEKIYDGGKMIIFLGALTIACAVVLHILFHFPAMWGMVFGISLLGFYTYFFNKSRGKKDISLFEYMQKIEMDTLMFFFGILAAVGALHYIGWLTYAEYLYEYLGSTATNIGIGVFSAIGGNVPIMSAVLKANPAMGIDEWLLVTLTIGLGGSLISFGSAAGVGVMGKIRGIYTFGAHMKLSWTVLLGYIVSVFVWWVQFEILGLY